MTNQEKLNEILGRYYGALVVHKQPVGPIVEDMQEALQDGEFNTLARHRLAEIAPIPDSRCFITKIHKRFLKESLNG